jgi:Tol biopolymer transport system component
VLHDVGSQDGIDFLVMEYLDGQTLAHRLRKGALPLAQALELGAQIADALATAHRHGIVHRDLKPANIMLTKAGAKLLDFGLAKLRPQPSAAMAGASALSTQAPATRPGAVMGTVPYMAPEQLEGKETDARTDLFAFGCVLYEMLTARRAFGGDSEASVISAIMSGEPAPLSTLQPLTPPALDRLVRRCLAKDPEARWQSAADLVHELTWLTIESTATDRRVAPPRTAGRSRWPMGRRGMLVAGALIVMAAAAFALWPHVKPRPPDAEVVSRQITASSTWDAQPALSPEGDLVAFSSCETGNANIYVVSVRGGTPMRVTDDPAWDTSPAWFPDSSQIAFVSDRLGGHAIWTVSLGGSATLLVPDAEDPAISPDGNRIAFVRAVSNSERRVFVAPLSDVASARMITTDADGLDDHLNPAWSPDGRTICYAAHRDLWCVGASGGGAHRLTTDSEVDREPTWSLDGRDVLFSSLRNGTEALWRVGVGGGTPTRLTFGNGPERHPSVSRDGRRLVYATTLENYDLELRDLRSGDTRSYGGLRAEVQPALSPDARVLYFISDREGKFDLWAQSLSGIVAVGPPQRLTDQPGSVSLPNCSPDGRWIAYGHVLRDRREVWVVPASGGPPTQVTDGAALNGEPVWSPDGTRIAFVSNRTREERVWLMPVSNGRSVGIARQLSFGPGTDQLPAWSPDGTQIAYLSLEGGSKAEVWVANVSRSASPKSVTKGARALDVRWVANPDRLLVNGFWNGASASVRSVPPGGGVPRLVTESLGREPPSFSFDISRDGRILVLTAEKRRGNVFVLEAASRVY